VYECERTQALDKYVERLTLDAKGPGVVGVVLAEEGLDVAAVVREHGAQRHRGDELHHAFAAGHGQHAVGRQAEVELDL
jgi:hypothetical protein